MGKDPHVPKGRITKRILVMSPGYGSIAGKKAAQMSWEAAESRSSSRMWVVRRKDELQENQASRVNVVMTS